MNGPFLCSPPSLKNAFRPREDQLAIHISDQGQGFDLKQVQDQLQQRHGRGEHRGWGLAIMRELMDEVEIESNEQGTTITMIKRR